MLKIDLHVHSKYSNFSQNPVIKFFKSGESFTEPEDIYRIAKARGMDLVTITDHDTIDGCLELKKSHGDSVILGVEATVFFPEDGCPIHLLIYGFTEIQFEQIDRLRNDIYRLRDYLSDERIPCSVAHASYRLKESLSVDHIEKLLLLFNTFEGINGCRSAGANRGFVDILKALTPSLIDELEKKHGIRPVGGAPWRKALTAGTDDHAGLYIGTVYTEIEADGPGEIKGAMNEGRMEIVGESRNHRLFALQIYKIIHDNFVSRNGNAGSLIKALNDYLFLGRRPGIRTRLGLWRLGRSRTLFGRQVKSLLAIAGDRKKGYPDRLKAVYDQAVSFSDTSIERFISNCVHSFENGTIKGLLGSVSAFMAGLFVHVPAGFALKYLNKDVLFQKKLRMHFIPGEKNYRKKILWFTDTINDLNGVSVTLRNIGWLSHQRGEDLHIISSVLDDEPRNDLPPNLVNLKPLFSFPLPFYEKLIMKVPSLLGMIETLYEYEPDEIYISSPGIIGLYGLIYARLTGVKCMAVYHTDFTQQAMRIIGKGSPLIDIIEGYTKWFHESADRILVPTQEYMDILAGRNFDRAKLGIFYRGIDAAHFEPKREGRDFIRSKLDIVEGINLVYAGRISRDKNIDFLVDSYRLLIAREPTANLIFAGDGPYMEQLRAVTAEFSRVRYMGEIPQTMLPLLYSGADILVFPSETDTFGMVVLEAQVCGLPVLVSSSGGPKDIIRNNHTGFILDTHDAGLWADKLEEMIRWIERDDSRYQEMCRNARQNVLVRFEHGRIIDSFFTESIDNPNEEGETGR
jgi:glycosyltransferase involved in cell wall biosynthesis